MRGVVYKDKKVVVAMPAYNAAKTLRKTYGEVMDQGIVDLVVIVDDASRDDTVEIAQKLPQYIFLDFLSGKENVHSVWAKTSNFILSFYWP